MGSKCYRSRLRLNSGGEIGNHPKILHHGEVTDNVIVLIHGITDSPYYVQSIAEDFAGAGFNVVLPLLPAHGLKRPGPAFRELKHTDWIADVDALVDVAKSLGSRVSIGGFSTGGALTVHKATRAPDEITGGMFLYSAALDIGAKEQLLLQTEAGRMIGRLKDDKLWFAKGVKDKIKMITDDQEAGKGNEYYGIGENPYKYSVFFYEGASQLAEVIQEVNQQYDDARTKFSDVTHPVFAAHSTSDESALFRGAKLLVDNHPNDAAELFEIENLPHASVVLKSAIIDDRRHEEYSPANPRYNDMSKQMLAFARSHVVAP